MNNSDMPTCGYQPTNPPRVRCTEPATRTLLHRYGQMGHLCTWHADEALTIAEWIEES